MLKVSVKQIKQLAVLWLIFISVLFFFPASDLPKENWLKDIHFDKWVHFGFFAILLFLWRFFFPEPARYTFLLLLISLCYGIGVELIQHYFVANRSFDIWDIIADMVGAIAGTWYWTRYKKNRPL